MLVLCSGGLTSAAVREALRPCVAGRERAALVVTADEVYKEKNYHVPRCAAELEGFGLRVDVLDIDKAPCAALERYGVVEFIGGNPFYLLASLRRHGAEPILRRVAASGVLIGCSAAAFAFGSTLALVNRYSPEMNTPGLTDLTALRLTDIEVLPHYSRFLSRFDRFEETCAGYEAERGVRVLRLNDGDAVLIDGEGARVVRREEEQAPRIV